MTIADILQQLQGEGRRDLSGLKKPNGQVANNLARHPEHFQHVGGNNRLWRLAALQAPSADTYSIAQKAHTAVKSQPAASEPSASDANQEQMVAVSKPPAAATRRSTRSASPTVKLAGNELVGLGCNVWWEGEQEWFPGQIEAWDPAGSTYTVQYADGDMEQVPKHETGQADLAEDDALEVADLGNNNSLVQDTVDSSEEDMPLSALAGRHTSASQITAPAHAPQAQTQAQPQAQAGAQNQAQDQAGAQAPAAPASQRVTRSRKADKPGAKPGLQIPNKDNQAEHSAVAVESAADTTAAKAVVEPSPSVQAQDAPADGPAQAASDNFSQFASKRLSHQQDAPGLQAAAGPAQAAELPTIAEPQLPGTTRIGLPSRPGLLGKGGLAGMGPSGGSTHIGPALSRGLLSALPTKAKASSETKQSTSAGSAGQKRKRSAKGSTDQDSAAKAKSGSSRQTSSFSAEGAVSPDDATGPKEEQQGKVGRQSTFRDAELHAEHAGGRHRGDSRPTSATKSTSRVDSARKTSQSNEAGLSGKAPQKSSADQRGRNISADRDRGHDREHDYDRGHNYDRERDYDRPCDHRRDHDYDRSSQLPKDRDSRDRYDGGRGKHVGTSHSYRSSSQARGAGQSTRPRNVSSSSTDRSRSRSSGRRKVGDEGGERRPASRNSTSPSTSATPSGSPVADGDFPAAFRNGRIFWSSDRTFKECVEKKLFATKDPKDISNIDGRTAVFLWNCFQRELHGVWVSVKEGNLDSRAFGGKFKHQARVREIRMFARPLPIERVLHVLPRKPHMPGTTFEQHLDRDSAQDWKQANPNFDEIQLDEEYYQSLGISEDELADQLSFLASDTDPEGQDFSSDQSSQAQASTSSFLMDEELDTDAWGPKAVTLAGFKVEEGAMIRCVLDAAGFDAVKRVTLFSGLSGGAVLTVVELLEEAGLPQLCIAVAEESDTGRVLGDMFAEAVKAQRGGKAPKKQLWDVAGHVSQRLPDLEELIGSQARHRVQARQQTQDQATNDSAQSGSFPSSSAATSQATQAEPINNRTPAIDISSSPQHQKPHATSAQAHLSADHELDESADKEQSSRLRLRTTSPGLQTKKPRMRDAAARQAKVDRSQAAKTQGPDDVMSKLREAGRASSQKENQEEQIQWRVADAAEAPVGSRALKKGELKALADRRGLNFEKLLADAWSRGIAVED
ncbi:hypothetical protein WJX82_011065 [Trebouxia sp. C0006]